MSMRPGLRDRSRRSIRRTRPLRRSAGSSHRSRPSSNPDMATPAHTLRSIPRPQVLARRVELPRPGWRGWVSTTDHKKIGILYLVTAFAFFMIGGVEALLMRIQLGSPDNTFLTPTAYNQLFTLHGTTMIFLFVVPMMAGFANYIVPLQIGARDMAFPRLNALRYWLFLCGGIVFYASLFLNPPQAGWASSSPPSSGAHPPHGRIDSGVYPIHPPLPSP